MRKYIKVLRDGELVVIREDQQKKTDLFFSIATEENKKPQQAEKKATGNKESEVTEESIDDLRAKYKEQTGKNAFNGWDIETLKDKLAN